MSHPMLVEPAELRAQAAAVVVDCRFSLQDPGAGRDLYRQGHIPGAHYLDLATDLSGPVAGHGGRHPLPDPARFIATLAALGIGPATPVVAYDDSRFAFAARLWWLMRSLGYLPPRLLNGGYRAWCEAGGEAEAGAAQRVGEPGTMPSQPAAFSGYCDIATLRQLQGRGATLVDAREARRYAGLEEPIDPVAGHIPGAVNRPWQGFTDAAGRLLGEAQLRRHWGDALGVEPVVVYCGSGVTACVNLFSLALLGREEDLLYAGSWSDWCSYL